MATQPCEYPKTLNIVWHGTFAFVPGPDGIEVLAPEVADHDNLAGRWQPGALEPLVRGRRYTLRGAKNNGKAPPFSKIMSMTGGLAADYQTRVYCSWILPHPKQIYTALSVDNDKNGSTNYGPGLKHPHITIPKEKLGVVYVTTFDFDPCEKFHVENLLWSPDPPVDGTVNLHVYAQEDHKIARETRNPHSTKAFQALVRLSKAGAAIPQEKLAALGVKVEFLDGAVAVLDPVKPGDLPPGLRRVELVSLEASGLLSKRAVPPPGPSGLRRIRPSVFRAIDTGESAAHPCVPGMIIH
ncbi:MAG TPA: hypothetical protein VKR61_14265 [Bryobacteraceae bacterium]|nr:hypothetical protein [Bryobacteraceae bacterium]